MECDSDLHIVSATTELQVDENGDHVGKNLPVSSV